MSEAFYCLDCRITGSLTIHGKCATCGSDAVTHPVSYGGKRGQVNSVVGISRGMDSVLLERGKVLELAHTAYVRFRGRRKLF